jgi:hypothetical protein
MKQGEVGVKVHCKENQVNKGFSLIGSVRYILIIIINIYSSITV